MSWLLSGPPDHWTTAFEHKMWGFRDTPPLKGLVDKLFEGDSLVFYCTAPVSGVIGHGTVVGKVFRGTEPLWPDEKKAGTVIYRHRFGFETSLILDEQDWQSRAIRLPELKLSLKIYASVNPIPNEAFTLLRETASKKWGKPPSPPDHDEIKDMIGEIGRLQGLIVEKEYPLEGFRRKHAYMDVAWKSIARGGPHQVFEVQVGGNLVEALSKLKHAFDIWHSDPFLVTTSEQVEEASILVEGAFHEIQSVLRILDWNKIKDLYDTKTRLNALELELGILLRKQVKEQKKERSSAKTISPLLT
mgnify:CR=1 FL=1